MGHPTTHICNVSITASNGINSQTISEEYFLTTALAGLSVGVENTTVLVGSNVTFKVFLIKVSTATHSPPRAFAHRSTCP